MSAKGKVFKYGDNVDTDVIIPARYLNTSDAKGTCCTLYGRYRFRFCKKCKRWRYNCCK